MSGKMTLLKRSGLAAMLTAGLLLGGCADSGYGTKQVVGAGTGAALGGLLGAQFGKGKGQLATTAAGAVIGGLIGSEVGKGLDQVDKMKAEQAQSAAQSAPIGQTITWSNPDTGHQGSVTPVREGVASTGEYCREFHHTIYVGERTEDAYGTACQQPDGSWQII